MNTKKKGKQTPAKGKQAPAAKRSRPSLAKRLLLNLLVVGVGVLLFHKVISSNEAYGWLWNTFAPNNLESVKYAKNMSLAQRMSLKLGVDFNYIMVMRDFTPDSAIVFYPSKEDFLATPKYGDKLQFSGTMTDKMTAIRFLYPRKVVVSGELGKTPYAKRITHVGIVNGKNVEMLHYPIDSTMMYTILPITAEQPQN